jgi:hypothetical protein
MRSIGITLLGTVVGEISGSHGGEYEERPLGYSAL